MASWHRPLWLLTNVCCLSLQGDEAVLDYVAGCLEDEDFEVGAGEGPCGVD